MGDLRRKSFGSSQYQSLEVDSQEYSWHETTTPTQHLLGNGDDFERKTGQRKLWGFIPLHCLPPKVGDFMLEYFTSDNAIIAILIILVIGLGSVNRVIYKIQLTPMKPYAIFISDILSFAYLLIYGSILCVRLFLGIAKRDMLFQNRWPYFDYKFIIMGFSDATGSVLGIFAARELSGYLLTLLPQGIVPMTMIITVVLLKTRYNWGQVLGAATLVIGIVITLVPDIISEKHSQEGNSRYYWALVYFLSSAPSALSFTLKEMVFAKRADMDIFVVNTTNSVFQFFFTMLYLPLVAAPSFGAIPFDDFGTYISNGAHCLVGIKKDDVSGHSCYGMPYATLIYVCVNISWNIAILMLVKKGGAVLTFISTASSLPIANLAFIFSWPLLEGAGFVYWDIIALFMVLLGLVIYRSFSLLQKKRLECEKLLAINEGEYDEDPLDK